MKLLVLLGMLKLLVFIRNVDTADVVRYVDIVSVIKNINIVIAVRNVDIATLGPTWEFQLCLKSCNLASWTTKWHDYATGTDKQWQPPR